jgi:hypothetical protein
LQQSGVLLHACVPALISSSLSGMIPPGEVISRFGMNSRVSG